MAIAINPQMPTYSGGLGILAGDTLRSAADLKLLLVAVTLAHRRGYFCRSLDESGWQCDRPDSWEPRDLRRAMRSEQGKPSPLSTKDYFRTVSSFSRQGSVLPKPPWRNSKRARGPARWRRRRRGSTR
ncbi:MAG: glucan phosphorylase [Verrucomicrobiales bacterium]|jgi:glucan phosphorylase